MDDTTLEQHEFSEVERFLAACRLRHAIVEHSETYTATAEARIAAVSPRHTAKTVMVRDDALYVLTVIPASELLDLRKLRRIAGRPGLRLAEEQELTRDFPGFEIGAFPPFGECSIAPGSWSDNCSRRRGSSATAGTTGIRPSSIRASCDSLPARRSPTSSPSAEATIRKSHRAPAGRGRGEQT